LTSKLDATLTRAQQTLFVNASDAVDVERSSSSSAQHWEHAAALLGGLHTVISNVGVNSDSKPTDAAHVESTLAESDREAVNLQPLSSTGMANGSNLLWRPINEANRHFIVIHYASSQTASTCTESTPVKADGSHSESFYPGLLKAFGHLGRIVTATANIQQAERRQSLEYLEELRAAEERIEIDSRFLRSTLVSMILGTDTSHCKSDAFLQLLGDPQYSVDYGDGSGRGFSAWLTAHNIESNAAAVAATRTSRATAERPGGDPRMEVNHGCVVIN